jgi:hypothetical protein
MKALIGFHEAGVPGRTKAKPDTRLNGVFMAAGVLA